MYFFQATLNTLSIVYRAYEAEVPNILNNCLHNAVLFLHPSDIAISDTEILKHITTLLCLGYIEFCLALSRFSRPKIGVLFLLEFSCNQLAISIQCSSDSQAAYYIFVRNFEVYFWIYTGYSGHFIDQCKILMGYFSFIFLSNQLQTLAQ